LGEVLGCGVGDEGLDAGDGAEGGFNGCVVLDNDRECHVEGHDVDQCHTYKSRIGSVAECDDQCDEDECQCCHEKVDYQCKPSLDTVQQVECTLRGIEKLHVPFFHFSGPAKGADSNQAAESFEEIAV